MSPERPGHMFAHQLRRMVEARLQRGDDRGGSGRVPQRNRDIA
jgi:hypothetical protein